MLHARQFLMSETYRREVLPIHAEDRPLIAQVRASGCAYLL